MKFIIIILILISGSYTFAGWISETDLNARKADPLAVIQNYMKSAKCISEESDVCFNSTGKDLRRVMAGVVDGLPTLVDDPSGIVAADAEDAQKASDQATRVTKKVDRNIELAQCIQDSKGTMTPVQQTACIGALVRELLGSRVDPADL